MMKNSLVFCWQLRKPVKNKKIPKLIVKDFVSNMLGNQDQLNMISIGVKNHKNLKSSQVGQLQGGKVRGQLLRFDTKSPI